MTIVKTKESQKEALLEEVLKKVLEFLHEYRKEFYSYKTFDVSKNSAHFAIALKEDSFETRVPFYNFLSDLEDEYGSKEIFFHFMEPALIEKLII